MKWSQRFGFEKSDEDTWTWHAWLAVVIISVCTSAAIPLGWEPRQGGRFGAWVVVVFFIQREIRDAWEHHRWGHDPKVYLRDGVGDLAGPLLIAGTVLWMT